MAQVIYPRWRPFLVPWLKLYTTMELVPVPLVPTCAKKWVYKAVKDSLKPVQGWTIMKLSRPCRPTVEQVERFSWTDPPLVLCQLSFLKFFFWVSQCHSIFRKTLLTKIFLQNTIMLERANNKRNDRDNRDHTLDHLGLFGLEFNSSTLWHQHTKQTLFESTTHWV